MLSDDFTHAEVATASPGKAEGDHSEETNSIGPDAVPALMRHLDTLFAFEATR